MRSFMESALLKGLTLAGAAVAVASCGGGGGSSGSSAGGLPGSGVTPANDYSLSLTSATSQLPLNVFGASAGIGVNAPYTTTLYVTGTRAGTRDPIPDGTNLACSVVPEGLESGALFYLDGDEEHEDEDGNPVGYRAITLDSSAGGASFHFHAGATAGTATITCSVTDPQSSKLVTATSSIAVGQSSGVSAQAQIAPAAPGFVYAQNTNGPSVLQLQARILDDAGQPVPNPAAGVSNLIARIVSTPGAADDFALLSAGGQLAKTVTLATIGGIAQFSLVSGAQTGSVLVEVIADRADNNVGNGVSTQVGNAVSIAVVDGSSSGEALAITSNGTLPGASVGQSYATILSASGGVPPYAWSLSSGSSLPGGLTLASDGIISGVPTSGGTFRFIVRARDSAGTPAEKLQEVALTVAGETTGSGGTLTVTAADLPKGSVGAYYAYAPAVTGGASPYAWVSTALPTGLALDSRTGFITGTPTASGTYPVVLTVTDANGVQANRNLSMVIDGAAGGGVGVDTTAPKLLFSIPTDGSTDVDRCSNIVARFDEAIDPVTVTNVSLFVRRRGGQTFSMASVSKLDDSTFALNQGDVCYDATANYELVLTDSIRDVSGNPLVASVVGFSTGGAVDTVAPQVAYTIPQRDAQEVDRCSDVVVRFNEAIDPVTVNNVSMYVRRQGGATFSMAGTEQIDDRTFVLSQFDEGGCYDPGTRYELVLTDSIRDVAQNTLVPDVVPFSTGGELDTTPPRVAYTIPADGAVDVSPTADVTVVFNEAMDTNSIVPQSFAVYRITGFGGTPTQVTVGSGSDTSPSTLPTATDLIAETDRRFTFGPVEYVDALPRLGLNLVPGQHYRVVMSASPRDLAGNQICNTSGQCGTTASPVEGATPSYSFEFRVGEQ